MEITRRNALAAGLIGGIGLQAAGLMGSRAAAQDITETPAPATLKVQMIIFDGFQLSDGLVPFDVLEIAKVQGAGFENSLVTVDGASEVLAFDNVVVKPTAAFDPDADLLIVPGAPARWRAGDTPKGLSEALVAFHAAGHQVTSVCTGAVFLARAGLLKGRNATTNHLAFDAIAAEGANVIKARVVDDGDIITAAGVTSGIDFALYLAERYYGPQIAWGTEQIIEHERRGVVWRKPA